MQLGSSSNGANWAFRLDHRSNRTLTITSRQPVIPVFYKSTDRGLIVSVPEKFIDKYMKQVASKQANFSSGWHRQTHTYKQGIQYIQDKNRCFRPSKKEEKMVLNENSKMREIRANPEAKAVLEKYSPGMWDNPQMKLVDHMSLKKLVAFPQSKPLKDNLPEILEQFSKIG